ncbi:Phage membrane protein [Magnetospirillum sp. LM-5]|uniref:hypothetical protein n=1 Tax=Magnetospirillum sp. LM-5 TaxID=2681466 RepID=UPI0013839945|nr:hypothetical protein [Magnetospirillum sp. LM-5]CAA7614668.1 Phage membrane protein [Magnetospirillum sp. LM-5]
MGWTNRLLAPLDYLRIQHETKRKYDWYLPGGLTAIAVGVFFILPVPPSVFGPSGLIDRLGQLVQILPGFYIAALAAISTFNKADMDDPMPEVPPTLAVTYRGKPFVLELTRRRFLSAMFGYLTFLSIGLYLGGLIANIVAPSLAMVIPQGYHVWAKAAFMAAYGFWQANMLITTLVALYYLSDRIHMVGPHHNKRNGEQPPAC